MVKDIEYIIHSNTPLHTRALRLEVWIQYVQILLTPYAEYFTLNEGWMRFELVTSCPISFNIMSTNQLNQKLSENFLVKMRQT